MLGLANGIKRFSRLNHIFGYFVVYISFMSRSNGQMQNYMEIVREAVTINGGRVICRLQYIYKTDACPYQVVKPWIPPRSISSPLRLI